MSYTFNGYDLEDYVIVEEVRRSILPVISLATYRVPGQSGEKHLRSTLGPREIEMDVRLIEDTKADLREAVRELAGILFTTEPVKLELNEDGLYEMAVLDGLTDLDEFLYTGGATLRFVAPSPATYGQDKTENLTGADIVNAGTYPADGVVTVTMTGAESALEVKNVTTGERVYIEHDLVEHDVVVVDLGAETVTKNGSSIMADVTLDSDFFEMPVGTFKVTVSAGTGVLTYTERWL